jgi:hypothetical protein
MTGDVCLKQNILYLTQIRSGLALKICWIFYSRDCLIYVFKKLNERALI